MKIFAKLDKMRNEVIEIRDNQKEIKCASNGCICEHFDLIIDELESLRDKFGDDFNEPEEQEHDETRRIMMEDFD